MASRIEEVQNLISYLTYCRDKLSSIEWEPSSTPHTIQASNHIARAVRVLRTLSVSLDVATDIPEYGASAAQLIKTLDELA